MIEVARLIVDLGQLGLLIWGLRLFRDTFGVDDSQDDEELATPMRIWEDLWLKCLTRSELSSLLTIAC